MNIKMITTAFGAAFAAVAAFAETTVDRVVVRQMWPWSTDVVIEYTLAGGTDMVDIDVKAWNGTTPLDAAALKKALSGEIYAVTGTEGVHRMRFDPVAAFGTAFEAMPAFKVELTASATAIQNPDEILYKIVDLTTGAIEDVKRIDFYNHPDRFGSFVTDYKVFGSEFSTTLENVLIWTGVTNDLKYVTTHLVLRKIPAGTFMMGSDSTDDWYADDQYKHQVTLTKNFWMGVFETTQKQNELLGAPDYNYFTNQPYAAWRPADNIRYKEDLRGRTVVDDPDAVDGDLVFGRLRALTGNVASFDLPTEAQWEYACRAGDQGPFYGGLTEYTDASTYKLGRTKNNGGGAQDRDADADHGTARPGRYVPNPWGLYDMLGNVWELCRDTWKLEVFEPVTEPQTDPMLREKGTSNARAPKRGNSWCNTSGVTLKTKVTAYRSYQTYANTRPEGGEAALQVGYRISFTEK